jgi:ATP phosphoribosyltransferase regulatory subunit
MTGRMVGVFAAHGYDCVRPPLLEFEESFLEGPGSAVAGQMFRLMDPVSHRMMGVRPDITPQVARIATTRLKGAPRPLRLSYAGPVLTVTGSELRPDREVTQVGIELIGSAALTADAEVISVTAEALRAIGVEQPSFDLSMPQLVPMVCEGLELDSDTAARARAALDRKDAGAIAALDGVDRNAVALLEALLMTAGFAGSALSELGGLTLPPAAEELVADLETVVRHVQTAAPGLRLTVDPVEFRGAEYQTGISFTIFAEGARGELGRGGRYPLDGETATGATLFVDALRRAVAPPPERTALYLPADTPLAEGARLREEGWRTVRALENGTDSRNEARALGCTHIFENGEARPLD